MIIDFLLDDIRKAIAGLEDEVSGLTAESFASVDYVSSAKTIYFYNAVDEVVDSIDLSAYWTSAETQSAITIVEDHLFDVEQVTASALTELHDDVLELSARTVDLSPYYTSAETKTYVDSAITIVQNQIDTMDDVVSAALVDLNDTKVASADVKHMVKLTQAQYDALTDKDPYTFYIIISNS